MIKKTQKKVDELQAVFDKEEREAVEAQETAERERREAEEARENADEKVVRMEQGLEAEERMAWSEVHLMPPFPWLRCLCAKIPRPCH